MTHDTENATENTTTPTAGGTGSSGYNSTDSTAIPHLVEMVVATTRYLGALSDLDDDAMRSPSLLPDWTRGHVVTHLARNADALGRLLHWAETGVERYMYESREQRDAEIEEGARRSAHDLRVDSAAAAGRFLQAINELDLHHEDVLVAGAPGAKTFPARRVAELRWIEMDVHHADLGTGFGPADWDPRLPQLLLDRVIDDRADGPAMVLRSSDTQRTWRYGVEGKGPEITGTACDLAWWVLGRGQGEGLESEGGTLPRLTPWR
jgi:maleylpyruvate isomerase